MYVKTHNIHNMHNIFSEAKKKRFTKKIDLFVFMNYIVGIGIQSLASQLFMIL